MFDTSNVNLDWPTALPRPTAAQMHFAGGYDESAWLGGESLALFTKRRGIEIEQPVLALAFRGLSGLAACLAGANRRRPLDPVLAALTLRKAARQAGPSDLKPLMLMLRQEHR